MRRTAQFCNDFKRRILRGRKLRTLLSFIGTFEVVFSDEGNIFIPVRVKGLSTEDRRDRITSLTISSNLTPVCLYGRIHSKISGPPMDMLFPSILLLEQDEQARDGVVPFEVLAYI
ncbi:unnamed protein product [Lepeophtheirus salmonis]|uniref:(salmon louse) hypothetical protein n=1 Tax=Lepeophtheirus salmonis TaxID=72036 RepID=A0A7R8CP16_LEPSM|nr:unnamed protein product [Lepeophtheirus salmonis]CAF2878155.1 unnamed protein product [Lepeophtheirus salmonis]